MAALRRYLSRLEDTLDERENLIASQEQVIANLKARLADASGWVGLLQQHSRFLLLACHPDRNPAHTESATAVTQALLALRKQVASPLIAP